MSTFISVIVPIYNIEDCLEKCIDSILNQTYDNFELILSDDGSTDRSGEIADRYAANNSRIKVIHKPNGGSSSARNEAIKIAGGEYYSFVDSDDFVEPDFLETLAKPVERAKADGTNVPLIVQVGRNEIDINGNIMPDICVPPAEETFINSKDFFKSLIMHIGDCSFCTKITAAELFKGRHFPEGKLNEDFHLLIQMLQDCDGVVSLPGYKYHVFYREGSNSRKKNKEDFSRVFKDNIDNADLVEKIVADKLPEFEKIAVRFGLFQRLDYLLHIPISFMRKDYEGYPECVHYIRKHFAEMLFNRYLTVKNKIYLTLFSIAPKGVRKIHAWIKHI
ncbi:MAG: glycosyltransferase [Lachnospiraceae bacterium]|nr:glycosyltransferase [Lachnospiraceae bacterium]